MAEGNFEAKVSAKRETSSGIFLTLQIQPDDYTADLATLRVGSALMIGWAEVVDTKVDPIDARFPNGIPPQETPFLKAAKERKPFDSLPLSQQAAMRCQDNDFKLFLAASNAEDAANAVRERCGVKSRSEIIEGTPAGTEWMFLEEEYQSWITTQRYGSLAR
jgi:hypothetical protein